MSSSLSNIRTKKPIIQHIPEQSQNIKQEIQEELSEKLEQKDNKEIAEEIKNIKVEDSISDTTVLEIVDNKDEVKDIKDVFVAQKDTADVKEKQFSKDIKKDKFSNFKGKKN